MFVAENEELPIDFLPPPPKKKKLLTKMDFLGGVIGHLVAM